MYLEQNVSVVIPAYNEEASVALVVRELFALQHMGAPIVDQIVVCDNGSMDATAEEAARAGAFVAYEERRGYGRACLAALTKIEAADVVVFVDADHSVEASELPDLLDCLAAGADLAIGSRLLGYCEPGAMSPHQHWGNQLVSFLMRKIWRMPITDLGPFRALRSHTLTQLNMCDEAYGWTVEMQAKALSLGLQVDEVPVTCKQRIGQSKVSGTWRGTIGATLGIFGMLGKIYWRYRGGRALQIQTL